MNWTPAMQCAYDNMMPDSYWENPKDVKFKAVNKEAFCSICGECDERCDETGTPFSSLDDYFDMCESCFEYEKSEGNLSYEN